MRTASYSVAGTRYGSRLAGHAAFIEATTPQELAMLRILYGTCAAALDAFRAADNPVDDQLVADLERMVERTKGEIERLSARLANDPAREGRGAS
jgi:hypothetical protein